MLYQKSKVYYDGSHYIAIPQENFERKQFNRKRSKTTTTTIVDQTKQKFETAYAESQSLSKRERKKYIAEKMRSEFSTTEQALDYIE